MGLTIRLAPGSGGVEYHTMEIVTSTSSTKLGIRVGGPPKTFLLTARKGGPGQFIRFQDLVDMLFSGKTRNRLREMIDERNKYPDLEDWQASLRLQETLGTAVQIWGECQHYLKDEDPYLAVVVKWAWRQQCDKSWVPPLWEPNMSRPQDFCGNYSTILSPIPVFTRSSLLPAPSHRLYSHDIVPIPPPREPLSDDVQPHSEGHRYAQQPRRVVEARMFGPAYAGSLEGPHAF